MARKWQQMLEDGAQKAADIVTSSGPDTLVVTKELLLAMVEALTEELTTPQDTVVVRGETVKFLFPNLRRYSLAEKLGFGESFRENWKKAVVNEAEMARLIANWPQFIAGVVDNPPQFLSDCENLMTGEVNAVALGFTLYARGTRRN